MKGRTFGCCDCTPTGSVSAIGAEAIPSVWLLRHLTRAAIAASFQSRYQATSATGSGSQLVVSPDTRSGIFQMSIRRRIKPSSICPSGALPLRTFLGQQYSRCPHKDKESRGKTPGCGLGLGVKVRAASVRRSLSNCRQGPGPCKPAEAMVWIALAGRLIRRTRRFPHSRSKRLIPGIGSLSTNQSHFLNE